MNNYDKYLSTKPKDFQTATDIAKRYNLPLRKVQEIARILNIKKDAANIYSFEKEELKRFKRFLKITSPTAH